MLAKADPPSIAHDSAARAVVSKSLIFVRALNRFFMGCLAENDPVLAGRGVVWGGVFFSVRLPPRKTFAGANRRDEPNLILPSRAHCRGSAELDKG